MMCPTSGLPVAGDIVLGAALLLTIAWDMSNFTTREALAVIFHIYLRAFLSNVASLTTAVAWL
jgi:hypothetical protein